MTPELRLLLSSTFVLLQPLAIAGIALINTGLVRSRNAAYMMTASLCVVSVAFLTYFAWGLGLQGWPSGWFLRGAGEPGAGVYVASSILSVGIACLIPLGAAAERWRLGSACASTVLLAGITYPALIRLLGPSWLGAGLESKLGAAFLDAGGSGYIQVTGGLTALALAWLLGPRRGKYSPNGMPAAIPAHNSVFVILGCLLAWVGWLGLNSAGAILHTNAAIETTAQIILNTTLCPAAAALASAIVTRIRFRKPDASLIANGWLSGLVASSAACATLKPAYLVLTGLVAGAIVVFSVEILEFHLKVDDPCGSVSVHAVNGLWGVFAAGLFSGHRGQLIAQIAGISTLIGVGLPLSFALNWILGNLVSHRAGPDGERQGLDLHDLGADAYPEFVVHADEFLPR